MTTYQASRVGYVAGDRPTTYTPEQIRENRAQWLAALRSGTYSQTKGYLRTDEGYCCLGVACDVAGIPSERLSTAAWNFGRYGMDQVLPEEGEEWLGVNTANPQLDIPFDLIEQGPRFPDEDFVAGGVGTTLAELNDGGLTFAQIADMIDYFGFLPSEDLLADDALLAGAL